jgi:hypothetical protein
VKNSVIILKSGLMYYKKNAQSFIPLNFLKCKREKDTTPSYLDILKQIMEILAVLDVENS